MYIAKDQHFLLLYNFVGLSLQVLSRVCTSSLKKKKFYFWLCWVFIAVFSLSLAVASGGYSGWGSKTSHCSVFSLWSKGCKAHKIQCGSRALEHRLSSCGTWAELLCGLGDFSSQTRDRTCVPCVGRQIPNHWTTGKPRSTSSACSAGTLPPCTSHVSLPFVSEVDIILTLEELAATAT